MNVRCFPRRRSTLFARTRFHFRLGIDERNCDAARGICARMREVLEVAPHQRQPKCAKRRAHYPRPKARSAYDDPRTRDEQKSLQPCE